MNSLKLAPKTLSEITEELEGNCRAQGRTGAYETTRPGLKCQNMGHFREKGEEC